MIALSQASNVMFLCIEIILQTQISPDFHIALIGADLRLNVPHVRLDPDFDLETPTLVRKPDVYLADLDQVPLEVTIDNFQSKTTFNPRAKFIFLSENVSDIYVDTLSKLFISNVIFIQQSSGKISTYYPYKNRAIHDMDKEVFAINNCYNLVGNLDDNNILFEDKIPETWNNSMVKFCFLWEPPYSFGPDEEKRGFNLDIFDFIAVFLQLKPTWISLSYPEDGDFNNYSRSSVKTNKICDLNLELFAMDGVDFTIPHVFDEVPFYVPSPLQIPRWKYLLKSLTIEIWLFWVCTSLFLSLLWLITSFVLEKRLDVLRMLEIFWLNVEFFIEKSHEVPRNYLSLRILFFFILLGSSMINMIFKCNFNLLLSGIIYEEPIKSLQDIVDRKMYFGLYQFEEVENLERILGMKNGTSSLKYYTCDLGIYCYNRTAFDRDMAMIESVRDFKYRQYDYLDQDGSPLMIKLEPSYQQTGMCALLPLGHPLTPALDKYIHIMQAFGFTNYFMSKYNYGSETKLPFKLHLMKLTLEHVITPSVLLIGGYVAGLILFVFQLRKSHVEKHSIWRMERNSLRKIN